jgi:transposase
MPKSNDLSRSPAAFDQSSTLIVVIEMSLSTWLVGGLVPGLARDPVKAVEPDAGRLLALIERWRAEAVKAGRTISRVVVAYEAGRDGFWLARWLSARGIEAHVMHSTSIAVSRESKRAKTDRLDLGLLKRALLGWLRQERGHCQMVAIPSLADEDAMRPNRERQALVAERGRLTNRMKATLVRLGIRDVNIRNKRSWDQLDGLRDPEGQPLPANTHRELQRQIAQVRLIEQQIAEIEAGRAAALAKAPETVRSRQIKTLTEVWWLGPQTAELLAGEVFWRDLRDRRAVARYAGLTGSPDESGKRRREKGLGRSGNGRVRVAMIQLAWRFVRYQPGCAPVRWFLERTRDAKGRGTGGGGLRKTMIVALARKLLIALWRLVRFGEVIEGLEFKRAPA